MKDRLRNKKHSPWTREDITSLVAVFIANIVIIGVVLCGIVWLNGLQQNTPVTFHEYFDKHWLDFMFLILAIIIVWAILTLYFYFENGEFIKRTSNFQMVFLVVETAVIISFLLGLYVNAYLRPLILCAVLLLPLTDRSTAIFTNMVACITIFLIDIFVNGIFYPMTANTLAIPLILGFACGAIAVYLMDGLYSRMQTLIRGLILAVPSFACMVVIEQGAFTWQNVVCSCCSGLLATALTLCFLPVFEFMFNRITTYRLAETTRHDAPLIRKMIEIAPGTFNHSVVVSNIAEACATAIGEDALLARACAYYHDMGKLKQPEYFTENQKNGYNPHDDLTPELSTSIIKAHTKDGYDLIRKYRLPTIFADMCMQHHGTMPIMYFFAKAKKFTDGEVALENFLHYGPKPQTKIAAILMIADSSEAAVRTMPERSRANVEAMVDKIIEERLKLGQFEECEITMKEIFIVKNTIVNTLTGIYHERIEYPKLNLEYLAKQNEALEKKDEKQNG